MSKYRVISGPYFPVFSLNVGKYESEITPYLETFHAVSSRNCLMIINQVISGANLAKLVGSVTI